MEYGDNQIAKIALMGVFAITLGAATDAFTLVRQNRTDFKWDSFTRPTAIADLPAQTVMTLIEGGDGDIVPAMIGMGRSL